MRNLLSIIFLFFVLSVSADINDVIPAAPNPPRLLNDFTSGTLSADETRALETRLVDLERESSNQIAILITDSTGDYGLSDYATAVIRKWGIGQKNKNNGVLILVNPYLRKIFIATGYGLEGALPDILAAKIIDHEITPWFREGNYYQGLLNGVEAINEAIKGEYEPEVRDGTGDDIDMFMLIIIVAVILLILWTSGGGRNGGRYISRRGYGTFLPTGTFSGRGGGFGGGFRGGGGGFGGFGGGFGGGGGAGGSW